MRWSKRAKNWFGMVQTLLSGYRQLSAVWRVSCCVGVLVASKCLYFLPHTPGVLAVEVLLDELLALGLFDAFLQGTMGLFVCLWIS